MRTKPQECMQCFDPLQKTGILLVL